MPYESPSFEIGERTLLEIEQQTNYARTPLTSRNKQTNDDENEIIIEESPNAKDNSSTFYQKDLAERFKNASQRGKMKRKFEKSKSNLTFRGDDEENKKSEISSISKYLQVEEIDFSAWERSAAKLISPAVKNASKFATIMDDFADINFSESFISESQEEMILNKKSKDDADCENSIHEMDNVTFLLPHEATKNDQVEADKLLQAEFDQHKQSNVSLLESDSIKTESVLAFSQNVVTCRKESHDESLSLDMNKDLRFISNWNLPQSIVNEYRKKGVEEMFDWQNECLRNTKVLFENANLVYSAPTSAGKTLVSEILMIKNVVERRKKAIFILPFVSVVREKTFYLQDLMTSSGIRVEGFFGGYHPPGGFESIDIAVCTIEKANSIINRLLEKNKLDEIGTIVIDEIHLISDSSRGYILELLLTKILYMCQKFHHKIQLVTMSATLPNVELLRDWLKAEFYRTDYRPIELREMIKIGKNIYDQRMKLLKEIDETWKDFFPNDSDEVCQLSMETILENCQLIIFCPSKDWCEQLSTNLARGIHGMLKTNAGGIVNILNKMRIEMLLEQAKALASGVDEKLIRNLGYGCAFHHAGLTTDERDLIEMGFKDGTLKVLVATSTLSSGVNLPARRVIIRTPMFGRSMMSNLTYRQMIGRAGRKGKDVLGESILVCNDATSRIGKQLVVTSLDPISSCLNADNNAHLKRALLEIIASGVANTKVDLEGFVKSTLYCQQHEIEFDWFQISNEDLKALINVKISSENETETDTDPIRSSMNFLLEYEFIRIHANDDNNDVQFVPTRLGLACLSSSLPPKDGFLLFSELQKSRQNFVLESELHAIYLVTPFSVAYQLQDIDWIYFAEVHDKLPEMMKRVGTMVGVSETYMIRAITGKHSSDWRSLQIHKRFYTALALQELVNEKSVTEVSMKYKIPRGMLQSLQQMASTFAGTVTTFCKSLQWNLLALILSQFRERLFFGIHPDLIDLMKIPSLNSTRVARALYKNGIERLNDLANCKTLAVENVILDLGENFFIAGKSLEMNAQQLANLMINEARHHLQNEMGLVGVQWTQQQSGNASRKDRKRKAKLSISDENTKRTRIDLNTSEEFKRNLRSSDTSTELLVVNTQLFNQLDKKADEDKEIDENASLFKDLESESSSSNESLLEHFQLVDVLVGDETFSQFEGELQEQNEIGMSIGIQKFEIKQQMIGGNLLQSSLKNFNFTFDKNFYIDCISFCCNANRVYFLNVQNDNVKLIERVKQMLIKLMNRSNLTLNIYEAKEQLKILFKALKPPHIGNFVKIRDPRIGSWILHPDTNLNWHQMVEKFSPKHAEVLQLAAKHQSTVSSLGMNFVSRVESKIRTAVECFLSNHLLEQQIELMKKTGNGTISRVFCDLEMSIQIVLMKMELNGFPINECKFQGMIEKASKLQRQLEQHIYELNGRKFNLSSSKEVSKVVGIHRNLENKKKLSTAKNVLEKLDLPIANYIMTWRTLSKTLSNFQPMTKLIRNERVYGNSFSLTQTGRISMYEPNLQNVTKDFIVKFKDYDEIVSFRSAFECSKGKLLLSADFCQLELRILTHLSKDSNLMSIMKSPGEDIFRKISAKWNKIDESDVTVVHRNQTKQLCYGIIYGMGNKALAETMKIDEEESAKVTAEFHAAYQGIKRYSDKTIQKARENGFIETVTLRRRYLPALNSESSSEKAQAERQALNSCIQGSASDLVKNAILRMDRNLNKNKLNDCNLVLHLHDELFYEVPEECIKDAGRILMQSMQNCVELRVPLLVKLKFGRSWGEMKDFQTLQ
ncbi:CLUMA_CG021390, isoform A [Clunio marinus]|uniref:CLUMA_CG021390, isoform A n=1 Tax=Clunio marinus TaxID=568069 RepID=A0A1J1J9U4_9DIPT|nr:CLUMA_CG021390, isoform A [Clunio marinus]